MARKSQNKLVSAAEDVRDAAVPAAEQAAASVASTVGPALSDAKDKLTPLLEDARDAIIPAAEAALAAVKEKSHDVAVSAGVVEEKKSHKLRNFLIVLGLGGAIAFAIKKLSGKDADPVWTESRDDAAAGRPATSSTAPVDQSDTAPTAPLGVRGDRGVTRPDHAGQPARGEAGLTRVPALAAGASCPSVSSARSRALCSA